MSIARAAYLFYPNQFVDQVKPFLNKLVRIKEGYQFLRSESLKQLEQNRNVDFLVKEYGGWDFESLKTQIPDGYPKDIEDIVFWFSLLLYSNAKEINSSNLGLDSSFLLLETILNELGWKGKELELLVNGRTFSELLPKPSSIGLHFRVGDVDIEQLWDYFNPNSTCGKFGWISFGDIKSLLSKLKVDQNRIFQLISDTNNSELEFIFEKYIKKLEEAKNIKSGLIYVISG
jgi:hypothetical protein